MTYPYTIPLAIFATIILHRLLVALVTWLGSDDTTEPTT